MIQPRDFSRSWVMYPVVSSPFSSVCPATVARFLSPSLCLSLRSWRPRGWRPSAVPTETRRRSSRSPSSPSCSGRWVWVARLWASRSLCCSFCRNTKDTDDWDSILCPGQRPPPGSCSSSVYVTYWDAQVKKGWPTFFFVFFLYRERKQRGRLLVPVTHANMRHVYPNTEETCCTAVKNCLLQMHMQFSSFSSNVRWWDITSKSPLKASRKLDKGNCVKK